VKYWHSRYRDPWPWDAIAWKMVFLELGDSDPRGLGRKPGSAITMAINLLTLYDIRITPNSAANQLLGNILVPISRVYLKAPELKCGSFASFLKSAFRNRKTG
jgi:hypothetical protein